MRENKKILSIMLVCMMVFTGFIGFLNITAENVEGAVLLNSTSSDGQYTPGTAVTVSMQSEANPAGAPIDHFEIWIYYGQVGTMPAHADTYNWIALDKTVAATQTSGDTYTGSYTFTIPVNHAGNIVIQANALDTDGRASQGSYLQIMTSEASGPTTDTTEPSPSEPTATVDYGCLSIVILIFVILLIGGILVRKKANTSKETLQPQQSYQPPQQQYQNYPQYPQPPQQPAPPKPPTEQRMEASQPDISKRLEKLTELKEKGMITEEDFQSKKAEILKEL